MIFQWLTDVLWNASVSMVHSWSTRWQDDAVSPVFMEDIIHGNLRSMHRSRWNDRLSSTGKTERLRYINYHFSKLSEAKKWAQLTQGMILEGRHFLTPEAKRHTLADLIDCYRREVLPHKKPSTISTQKQHLRWWQTYLGYYLPADITPSVLAEYRTILAYGRANATVARCLAVLSHAFTMGHFLLSRLS
jgi:hypothetical protein